MKNDDDPTPAQIETRWLPMFIDLLKGSSSDENFAVLPDYGYLFNLTDSELVAAKNYYLYFVHPETPAAVPLLRDEDGTPSHHNGIEIRVEAAEDTGTSDLGFRINVLVMVES